MAYTNNNANIANKGQRKNAFLGQRFRPTQAKFGNSRNAVPTSRHWVSHTGKNETLFKPVLPQID